MPELSKLDIPTLEDLPNVAGRAVLVRATLDLPFGATASKPMASRRAAGLGRTLHWLLDRGARVTVCGDAGPPDVDQGIDDFARIRAVVHGIAPEVSVVDNLSDAGASAEDPRVIEALIASHDLFVNDSFQWSYLPLPSLVLPPRHLPSAVGRNVQENLELLEPLLISPKRPFVSVLGGDRTLLRLHGLRGLVLRADTVLVGGAMAMPLLQAIGKQPHGQDQLDFLSECRSVHGLGLQVRHQIMLPLDLVWSSPDGAVELTAPDIVGAGAVMDIGPDTRRRFVEVLQGAGTILWTGVLGRVEDPRFAEGTRAVAGGLKNDRATKLVGGDALGGLLDAEGFLSAEVGVLSATDAALELLKVGDLPGLVALRAHK